MQDEIFMRNNPNKPGKCFQNGAGTSGNGILNNMFRLLGYLVAGIICSLLLSSCNSTITCDYTHPVIKPTTAQTSYKAAILRVKNKTDREYIYPGTQVELYIDEKSWTMAYTKILYSVVVNSGFFKHVEIIDSDNLQNVPAGFDVIFSGELLEIKNGGNNSPFVYILPPCALEWIGLPICFGYYNSLQRFVVNAYVPNVRNKFWSFDSGKIEKEMFKWKSKWGINNTAFGEVDRQVAQKVTSLVAIKLMNDWQSFAEQDFKYQMSSLLAGENNKNIAKKPEMPSSPEPELNAVSFNGTTDFGNYHAIVIGIDQYRDLPALKTAVSDAQSIAAMLSKDYGFKVNLVLNPTRSQILDELARARQTLTENDNLLIYYAGHGWLDNGADQGYWMPADASRNSKANWISNTDVTSEILGMSSKHVMVVADSCYSGKLTRGFQIKELTPDYMTRMARKKARVVLSSGGLEPVADSGGNGKHSVFATAFMTALQENSGALDGTNLFTKIRHPVMVNSDQTPEYSDIHKAGHDGGDFIFVRKTAAAK